MKKNYKKLYEKVLEEIIKQRDERLKKSKEDCDYEFCVAHGLTEAIRAFDKVEEELGYRDYLEML